MKKLTILYSHENRSSNFVTIFCHINHGHGVKVGPGPRDPATHDPSQSLKMGPGIILNIKSTTPGPPSKFESGTPGPALEV